MTYAIVDTKKLYEINQFLKNHPYYYDLKDHHFVSHDNQSDIMVSNGVFKIEGLQVKKRFLYIEDGKALFKFLGEHKKGEGRGKAAVIPEMRLTSKGFECKGEVFPVEFRDKVNLELLSNEPLSQLKQLDCVKASLHYENDLLKEGNITMNDIIDVIAHKKTQVDNLFIFMEIIGKEIHLYESKFKLTLQNKTLICLDNFNPLKNKKGETEEYLHMYIGKNRLYISYGNSEYDFIYKFHIHDLH
jgi:hypothetical protein